MNPLYCLVVIVALFSLSSGLGIGYLLRDNGVDLDLFS